MRQLKSRECRAVQRRDTIECFTSDFFCPKKNNAGEFGSDCFKRKRGRQR